MDATMDATMEPRGLSPGDVQRRHRPSIALLAFLASASASASVHAAPHDPVDDKLPAPPEAQHGELHDEALVTGAVVGAALGCVFGGVAAGTFFVDAVTAAQAQSGCVAEGCEGYGLTLFFAPVVVLAGAAGGGLVGGLFGGWVGGELADADWSTPSDDAP